MGSFDKLNSMKKEMAKIYEPSKYEDGIYKKWEESGSFQPEAGQPQADNLDNLKLDKKAESYIISMPPPNVTGTLHMGHGVTLVIEDILIRFNRMRGKRVLWLPGSDHAAIATQTKVEKILKEEGMNRHELGRDKFLKRVEQYAQESHDTIIGQMKKMGSSCDWSREAYTLDEMRTKAVRSVFKMMFDDGLIYRGERIVNWCPRCHSTLADDEVEYKAQKTKVYTFKYSRDFPFAISTTRPETKLGDTGVAVNPKDKRYKKYIGEEYKVDFCGVRLKLKIIADRGVDMKFGTGAVGVTPAHSFIDGQMAEKNNLEIKKVINEEGNIHEDFVGFSGKNILEAREEIVKKLKAQKLLTKEEEIDNNLSLCYRCDTPIEPLPSLQWFIDVNKKIARYKKSLKELSIEAVKKGVFNREKIRIIPERFVKNYFHWMNNLRDWCISRQIWFGHRIPVWYCRGNDMEQCLPDCKKPIVSINTPKECPACGSKDLVQDKDTLDTWFSSGLWTFSTLANSPDQIKIKNKRLIIDSDDFKKFHPTSVLETGYDILFFWVARMIIMTTYAVQDIPFQDVYLHGLIRDALGRKMSKSLGNVINPLDMINKYGTDAVRLSLVIGTTPGNDMNLSEDKIAGYRNFTNKLWNIARYIITNPPATARHEWAGYELRTRLPLRGTSGQVTNYEFDQEKLTNADKYILEKMGYLIDEITGDLNDYSFSQAGEKLREFTWAEFADWYLEVSKFEKSKEKSLILFYILENLLKLWHPFMPFVTEKIWEEMGKAKMLIIEKWPLNTSLIKGDRGINNFEIIKNIISAIRIIRAENKIEPAKKIKAVIFAGEQMNLIKSQEILIKSLRTGISELEIKKSGVKPKNAIAISIGGIEIHIIGAVDKEKEKERIVKEIENLEKLIKSAKIKLSNKDFLNKAPGKIVKAEMKKLKERENELEKLKKAGKS